MTHDHWLRHGFGFGCAATAVALVLACTTKAKGPSCTSPGGAVTGAQDTHCDSPTGPIVQVVDQAACTSPLPDAGTGDDGGAAGDDGGAVPDAGDIGNCGDPGYGATMFGQSGADDDCKYDVTWTSTPICEGQPVYFTVTATTRTSDHSPVTGANPRPDVVLDCTHPIPNDPKPADPSPETSPGTYTVGPLEFDQPGRWVFRFHFFETCNDVAASPHGHAAFYIDVP